VNKNARKRLIVATVVIVVAFIAGVVYLVTKQGAYYRQVGELTSQDLSGKTVKVGGAVIDGSITRDAGGAHFAIRDLTGKSATVRVTYNGQMPGTFGAGVDVVVTGSYSAASGVISADSVQTKCPSKYKGQASPQAQATP
jgi:cytochrome c-type biogenesis protein CcmE